jgi:hypothetical protein
VRVMHPILTRRRKRTLHMVCPTPLDRRFVFPPGSCPSGFTPEQGGCRFIRQWEGEAPAEPNGGHVFTRFRLGGSLALPKMTINRQPASSGGLPALCAGGASD